MDFYDVIIVVAGRSVTLLEIIIGAGIFALILLAAILIVVWRAGRRRNDDVINAQRRAGELENRLAELGGQLKHFSQSSATREAQSARSLDDRLDKVSHRLGSGMADSTERTTKSLQHLYERLAVIDTAQKKCFKCFMNKIKLITN